MEERCYHCGCIMQVEKVQPGSEYQTRSYFRVGQLVAKCTNPACCNQGYLIGLGVESDRQSLLEEVN